MRLAVGMRVAAELNLGMGIQQGLKRLRSVKRLFRMGSRRDHGHHSGSKLSLFLRRRILVRFRLCAEATEMPHTHQSDQSENRPRHMIKPFFLVWVRNRPPGQSSPQVTR